MGENYDQTNPLWLWWFTTLEKLLPTKIGQILWWKWKKKQLLQKHISLTPLLCRVLPPVMIYNFWKQITTKQIASQSQLSFFGGRFLVPANVMFHWVSYSESYSKSSTTTTTTTTTTNTTTTITIVHICTSSSPDKTKVDLLFTTIWSDCCLMVNTEMFDLVVY